MSAVETISADLQIAQCRCKTDRLPDLVRSTGKRTSLQVWCRACGTTGLASYSPAAVARKWNDAMVSA